MKVIKIIFKIFVYGFALIGFVLTAGFFAVRLNLTNTLAIVDKNNDKYQAASAKFSQTTKPKSTILLSSMASSSTSTMGLSELESQLTKLQDASTDLNKLRIQKVRDLCRIAVVGEVAPANAKEIALIYQNNASRWTFDQMLLAVALRLENNLDWQSKLASCDELENSTASESEVLNRFQSTVEKNIFGWVNSESWPIITRAILKDEAVIKKAAQDIDINPRLLVSILIVEQLRLYNTQREYFEKFFKPLEILANANKMAWGVMAIKEKAAIDIETNLKNKNSSMYLGEGYEKILDFKTADIAKERYERLTDSHDHYYSYLYGGLLVKELISQWDKAGYNISNRPEVIATLFNIGFTRSRPKDNPQVGGSIITLDNVDYTFGSLAHEFYYSNLIPEFPLN